MQLIKFCYVYIYIGWKKNIQNLISILDHHQRWNRARVIEMLMIFSIKDIKLLNSTKRKACTSWSPLLDTRHLSLD